MMKSYVISVSLGAGCYRHIQISASATLYKLHKAILQAFEFDDDHAHAFFMDDRYWGHGDAYFSMKMNGDERLTKSYRLERFHFTKGAKFKYLFDYGDEWRIQCKVLREVDEKTDIPRVIRSVGESPEQYPEVDEAWSEDIWDDGAWEENEEFDDWEDEPISQEELNALYAVIPLKKKEIRMIQRYFDAASRLYGLISLDKLYDIYISQNAPVSREDFFMVAAVSAQEEHQYVINQCGNLSQSDISGNLAALEVAAEYLFYDDDTRDYCQLRRQQKKSEFKVMPKQEFLRYEDPYGHPETPENRALLTFLKKKEASFTESAQSMCHAIQNFLMLDISIADILQFLQPYGLQVDRKTELLDFEKLIKDLDWCTPKQKYRGHTPEEMFSMSRKGKELAERNAPCPCGSGRKYKNCCGKGK